MRNNHMVTWFMCAAKIKMYETGTIKFREPYLHNGKNHGE